MSAFIILLLVSICTVLMYLYLDLRTKQESTQQRVDSYKQLLDHHGVCVKCREMYSHSIDEPFASCRCWTSEWYRLTPYMKLEQRIYRASTVALPVVEVDENNVTVKDVTAYGELVRDVIRHQLKFDISAETPTELMGGEGAPGYGGPSEHEGPPGAASDSCCADKHS